MDQPVHIVCPSCATINRVPQSRLDQAPNCGHCGQPLFLRQPLALTAASFDKHIGRSEIPVAVDFWADWCGPCKMMAPHFARAAAELEPRMRLAKLDTEAARAIAERYSLRGIPTVIVFDAGREAARRSGAMDTRALVSWLAPLARAKPGATG